MKRQIGILLDAFIMIDLTYAFFNAEVLPGTALSTKIFCFFQWIKEYRNL